MHHFNYHLLNDTDDIYKIMAGIKNQLEYTPIAE